MKIHKIKITGVINDDVAADVVDQLDRLPRSVKKIEVRINSQDGTVASGRAIFDALVTHRAKVHTIIAGEVSSIAIAIALAGDERSITSGSAINVQEVQPSESRIENILDAVKNANEGLKRLYIKRTGQPIEVIGEMFNGKDTFLDAEKAKRLGFVHNIIDVGGTPDKATRAQSVWAFADVKELGQLVAMADDATEVKTEVPFIITDNIDSKTGEEFLEYIEALKPDQSPIVFLNSDGGCLDTTKIITRAIARRGDVRCVFTKAHSAAAWIAVTCKQTEAANSTATMMIHRSTIRAPDGSNRLDADDTTDREIGRAIDSNLDIAHAIEKKSRGKIRAVDIAARLMMPKYNEQKWTASQALKAGLCDKILKTKTNKPITKKEQEVSMIHGPNGAQTNYGVLRHGQPFPFNTKAQAMADMRANGGAAYRQEPFGRREQIGFVDPASITPHDQNFIAGRGDFDFLNEPQAEKPRDFSLIEGRG